MNAHEKKAITEQYKNYINHMTTEQIQQRSLLVSMSTDTPNNRLFQKLLTEEYKKRIA